MLPYQNEMIELSNRGQLTLIEHAPRVGATFAFAKCAVEAGAFGKGDGFTYMAPSFGMAEEFMSYCAEIIRFESYNATAIDRFLATTVSGEAGEGLRIRFSTGRDIVAVPAHVVNLRRLGGSILIDEAGFMDGLEKLVLAAIASSSYGRRPITLVSRCQRQSSNFFNVLLEMIRRHEIDGTCMAITIRDAVEGGLYRLRCSMIGEEWSLEGQSAWEANLRRLFGGTAATELDLVHNG